MATGKTLLTADDLLTLPDGGRRYELIDGVPRKMSPVSPMAGSAAANLAGFVIPHVRSQDLGRVFINDTGFRLRRDPDRVRAPDLAFVARDRLPADLSGSGFPDLVPDLVVEVISPSDKAYDVQDKLQEWLEAGVRLVWVLYPQARSILVYRSLGDVRGLAEADELSGEDVLPGFACAVRDLFL